jgi:hypothetical protein
MKENLKVQFSIVGCDLQDFSNGYFPSIGVSLPITPGDTIQRDPVIFLLFSNKFLVSRGGRNSNLFMPRKKGNIPWTQGLPPLSLGKIALGNKGLSPRWQKLPDRGHSLHAIRRLFFGQICRP